jgi:fructoselysine-6-P-deglycase FrlB-like protein
MTALWRETCGIPEALAATLDARDGIAEIAALLAHPEVSRVVATGNGAAFYAAHALWLASLAGGEGPEVVAVPSGLVARGTFRWRAGDALLAFSSSGEFRDVVEAIDAGVPLPYAAVTATPDSSIGGRAGARALVTVLRQEAVTHTQAFCGAVAAALSAWAEVTGDEGLRTAVAGAPDAVARALGEAERWAEDVACPSAPAAVAFGTGPAWSAALETALLLKEVAGIPTEGVETREGATSAMMALAPGHLAVSLPLADDPLLTEAARICSARGATLVRAPGGELADPRLAAITTFPAGVALAVRLGLARGLDVDAPAWTDAYYSVAR